MINHIRKLLFEDDCEIVGNHCTIRKTDNGIALEFYSVKHPSVIYATWQALTSLLPDTEKFHIYYQGQSVIFRWQDEPPSVAFDDPYKKVKQSLAARDRQKRRHNERF